MYIQRRYFLKSKQYIIYCNKSLQIHFPLQITYCWYKTYSIRYFIFLIYYIKSDWFTKAFAVLISFESLLGSSTFY